MKRNKLLAIVILFAVVVCCTSLFFACNTGSQDSEESLRIFYDWADGSAPIEKVIKAKDVASVTSALTPPTRDGYAFIGWSLTKDGDRIVFGEDTVIADGATLYALWQYTRITLYYDLQDGSEAVEKLIEKADIKSTSQAMVTTKEGYDFAGWALAKDGDILDMDNLPAIQDGSTLYAQWKVKEYTVIFSIDEFTVVERQNVEHGKTATLPSKEAMAEYVEDGKTFVGWVYTDGTTFDVSKPITQKTVVYAVFSDVNYTVKFQNGDDIIKEVTGGVGTQIVAPLATEQPSKTGYTFSHWATKDGKKFEEGAVYKQNETYYATYTLNAPSKPSLSGNSTITYGESQTISAQINDSVAGITYSFVWSMDNDELGKGSSLTLNKLSAGKYSVRCDAIASDGTLTSATTSAQTFDFIVEKATLTATIEDINLTYGDELPDFEIKYDGFKYGETASVVTGNSEPSTNYFAGANVVDKYSVTIQGLTADNYIIVGTVGIDKSITATINVAKKGINFRESVILDNGTTYNGEKFAMTYTTPHFDGLLDGHNITFTVSTTSANAKRYTGADLATSLQITNEDGDDVSKNYSFNVTSDDITLTISKGTIDYTAASSYSATYNGKDQDPTKELLVNGESILGTYAIYYATNENDIEDTQNKTLPSFINASNYTLYFRIDAGANYEAAIGNIEITINKAHVKVLANEQGTTYGDAFELDQTKYTLEGDEEVKKLAKDELNITLTTNYEVGNKVDSYTIFVKIDENNNFEIDTENSILNVGQRSISVIMNPATVSYGESLENVASYIKSVEGLYEGDTSKLDTIISAYVDSKIYDLGYTVGTYKDAITCQLLDETNYALSLTKADLTVVQKQVSVTFITDAEGNPTFRGYVYGDGLYPSFGYVEGTQNLFYDNDFSEHFLNDVTYQHDYVPYDETTNKYGNAGKYDVSVLPITKDSYTAQNYDITFTNGDKLAFIVDARSIRLSLNSTEVTYGEPLSALTYSIPEGGNNFIEGDDLNITYEHDYAAGKWGTFTWSMRVGNSNYNVEYNAVNAEITVTARPVTVTYENLSIAQKPGTTYISLLDPTVTIGGMGIYGDDIMEGCIAVETNDIGEYTYDSEKVTANALIQSSETEPITGRYTFTYNISVKVIEISIDHKIEGTITTYNGKAQSPTITFDEGVTATYTYDGTTSSTMPSFTDAGTYTISYTLTQDGKTPYSSTIDFEIKKYALEIILREEHLPESINEPAFRVQFGDELNIPDTELKNYYNFSKDVWDDLGTTDAQFITDLNVQINIGYERGVTGAGTHDVKEVTWNSDFDKNFDITCDTKGQLKVTPQPIVVYGGSYTTVYGENAVAYTSGFSTHLYVYGETYDPSGSNPHFEENANEIAKLAAQYITIMPKDYTVGAWGTFDTVATCSNPNYEVKEKECEVMMTTTKRSVTIKADDKSIVYGESANFTYTADGLYGEDKLNVTYNVDNMNVGKHDITITPQDNERYEVNVAEEKGILTITKASLTASLSETQTITYGDAMPAYTVSYTGFVNGENESVVNGTLAISCDYMTTKKVGEFSVTASGLSADNYDIKYVGSTLVVKKATLSATLIGTSTITYGDDMPTYTVSYTGFVNGEDESVVNGTLAISCDYMTTKKVGEFSVTASGLSAANYNIEFASFNLEVNKATLHISADACAPITYGDDAPIFTYTVTIADLVNNDTADKVLQGKISFSCNYTKGNNAGGDYTFNVVCDELANYSVVIGDAQTLVVNKKQAVITGDTEYKTDYNAGDTIVLEDVIKNISTNNTDNPTFNTVIKIYNTNTVVDTIIDGGVYTVTYSLPATTNFLAPEDFETTLKVAFVDYNGTLYTLEDALKATTSGTLTVKGNGFVSSDIIIPSGITLVLPRNAGTSTTVGSPDYRSLKDDSSNDGNINSQGYVDLTYTPDYTLTINNNVTITIAGGNIIVGGLLGNQSQPMQGHTSGTYSKIINNGTITMTSGNFDVRGYVTGTGEATFHGGTVYNPFVVLDFKGGSYTLYTYTTASPFSQFEMPNIQCHSIFYSGASEIGYACLYTGKKLIFSAQYNKTQIDVIGSKGIFQIGNGGYIDKTYNRSTQKTTLKFVGTFTIGSLELPVKVTGVSKTVSMDDVFFPIAWTYSIFIGDGTTATTVTAPAQYKILPGATITVKSNATLNLSGGDGGIVYSDFTCTNAIKEYPTQYGTAGKFTLDGGTLTAQKFGGIIYATSNGGTVKISSAVSVTSKEAINDDNDTVSITETARFEDGTALSAGTTYTYNGTSWAQA